MAQKKRPDKPAAEDDGIVSIAPFVCGAVSLPV
jgi:hypothetical protein